MKDSERWLNYRIKVALIGGIASFLLVCIFLAAFTGRKIIVEKKRDADAGQCLLCGINSRGLMGYYRKMDTIGLISLNDWEIIDLRLKNYDREGNELPAGNHTSVYFGSSQNMKYIGSGSPSAGCASLDITLSKDYKVDAEFLQKNLCDKCLEKVMDCLKSGEKGNQVGRAIPACLVDFGTLETYSIQGSVK